MGTTLGSLKRKRRQPDVRSIKKRSDYTKDYDNSIIVGGMRDKTDYGFVVDGFKGKSFETYFEHMEAQTSSPVLMHEKKDKVIRVLSGILYVICKKDDEAKQVKAIPGDEVVLARGTSYRLSTLADSADLFICQNAKYTATLEVLDDTTAVSVDVPDSLLKEPTLQARLQRSLPHTLGTARKGSKAKEQLAKLRSARDNRVVEKAKPLASNVVAANVEGSNLRPSHGNFSAEGAG
jgi:mannose-6-phosphate isomerase-like protein (cupin superfamily)